MKMMKTSLHGVGSNSSRSVAPKDQVRLLGLITEPNIASNPFPQTHGMGAPPRYAVWCAGRLAEWQDGWLHGRALNSVKSTN